MQIIKVSQLINQTVTLTVKQEQFYRGTTLELDLSSYTHYNGAAFNNPHIALLDVPWDKSREGETHTVKIQGALIKKAEWRDTDTFGSVEEYYQDHDVQDIYFNKCAGVYGEVLPYPVLHVLFTHEGEIRAASSKLTMCPVPEAWYTDAVARAGFLDFTKGYYDTLSDLPCAFNEGLSFFVDKREHPIVVFPSTVSDEDILSATSNSIDRSPVMYYAGLKVIGLHVTTPTLKDTLKSCYRLRGKLARGKKYVWRGLF